MEHWVQHLISSPLKTLLIGFESFLSWNTRFNPHRTNGSADPSAKFQSLLSWNTRFNFAYPLIRNRRGRGFNPCCHGTLGSTPGWPSTPAPTSSVSILVVMEHSVQ